MAESVQQTDVIVLAFALRESEQVFFQRIVNVGRRVAKQGVPVRSKRRVGLRRAFAERVYSRQSGKEVTLFSKQNPRIGNGAGVLFLTPRRLAVFGKSRQNFDLIGCQNERQL